MYTRSWPPYGHNPYYNPYAPNVSHYPNPTTVAGQSAYYPTHPPHYGYSYPPGGGYYAQPSYPPNYSNASSNSQFHAQTSTTPMMPPNTSSYQSNLQGEAYQEVWESPQSPQSPWIKAYEKHKEEEKTE